MPTESSSLLMMTVLYCQLRFSIFPINTSLLQVRFSPPSGAGLFTIRRQSVRGRSLRASDHLIDAVDEFTEL